MDAEGLEFVVAFVPGGFRCVVAVVYVHAVAGEEAAGAGVSCTARAPPTFAVGVLLEVGLLAAAPGSSVAGCAGAGGASVLVAAGSLAGGDECAAVGFSAGVWGPRSWHQGRRLRWAMDATQSVAVASPCVSCTSMVAPAGASRGTGM